MAIAPTVVTMTKAVQFDQYGGIDVLQVRDVPRAVPAPDEVLVQVRAAGINPGEAKIRTGMLHDRFPATFPSGQGSDLAGVVVEAGHGVARFAPGDEVFGYTDNRASHAEFVVVPASQLVTKPEGLSWEVAGSLFVAGTTAYAAVGSVHLSPGDVVAVSAAAGGVGTIAVQLARAAGATVIGIAGPDNDEWLTAHGVIPVNYGDGLAERIKAAAPQGRVDAFLDLFGGGYVDLALNELGVDLQRIDTIIDFAAIERYGVQSVGNAEGASAQVLSELAALIVDGKLEVTVAQTFPLDAVRSAYELLERQHTRGKIVLVP
ncbi:putative oxidoreductase [Mycobacteroides abscessus subsp. bolletii]|uniref:Oxidoreductase n=2 Tax=Mycobacteroides abscessus TaxID=36809 RepID=A0A9Q7SJT2_9MYCO|nr:putative oxidoreductase [Mycobacteroides abscessus subsp. bolletii]SHV13066.1 putative oxidoreductase [Mycobacteroides abscessus subsp. bolletii]SHY17672.1 putative oxidoreductase [Mycobacteroides abscessus subsp. bolletii]SKL67390.1 putative oxidoreductase [Mycobacteroides abscessus subsp. bolletii]SKM92024.1 putative oxidoreductase [Mycobacteroides abscessus subsp. bolletii]